MSEATVTSKGQVTIPKDVRDALGVGPGDRIDFVDMGNGFMVVPVKGDLKSLQGMFKGRRKKALTIDEMNELIAQMGNRR